MKLLLNITLIATFFMFVVTSCSGVSKSSTSNGSIADSTANTKSLLEQTWDSIYNAYNEDGNKSIKNEIVQGEVRALLMAYIWDHKGKHLPLIEEPVYKCLGLAEDKGKYYGCFDSNPDHEFNPWVQIQILGEIPYDKAKELIEGEMYIIKGEIIDFAYPKDQNLWPKLTEDTYSAGCIKLKNCTFEKYTK